MPEGVPPVVNFAAIVVHKALNLNVIIPSGYHLFTRDTDGFGSTLFKTQISELRKTMHINSSLASHTLGLFGPATEKSKEDPITTTSNAHTNDAARYAVANSQQTAATSHKPSDPTSIEETTYSDPRVATSDKTDGDPLLDAGLTEAEDIIQSATEAQINAIKASLGISNAGPTSAEDLAPITDQGVVDSMWAQIFEQQRHTEILEDSPMVAVPKG